MRPKIKRVLSASFLTIVGAACGGEGPTPPPVKPNPGRVAVELQFVPSGAAAAILELEGDSLSNPESAGGTRLIVSTKLGNVTRILLTGPIANGEVATIHKADRNKPPAIRLLQLSSGRDSGYAMLGVAGVRATPVTK